MTAATIAGENRFSAYAFDSDNIKSKDALALVKAPGEPRPGVAYVLSIGVNRYANPDPKFTLRHAVADAEAVTDQFFQRQKELSQFAAVSTAILRDQEATSANILLALSRLAGENPGPLPAWAPPARRCAPCGRKIR